MQQELIEMLEEIIPYVEVWHKEDQDVLDKAEALVEKAKNNAPAVQQGLERYEPTVMVEESRGRLTATGAVMKPKEDGRWVRLRDLTATPAPAPAQEIDKSVADAEIKVMYVESQGSEKGWLGIEGSYFIGGVVAARKQKAAPAPAQGEHYAGIALDAEGQPSHHLILLPGDVDMTVSKAHEWAASIGGELPTRQEQALLFANLKGKFEPAYYWSNEQHASDTAYAWSQHFINGYQSYGFKGSELRARAVRRVPIQQSIMTKPANLS